MSLSSTPAVLYADTEMAGGVDNSRLTLITYPDSNGNMTVDQNGNQYVYDAWNRLVAVKNSSGTMLEAYSDDGLNRLVTGP